MPAISFDSILEVEDSLQAGGVFVNGIDGRTAHSDSYMTVVDYIKLGEWMAKRPFVERWDECIKYWTTNPNMQPPLKLVAFTLRRNK